MTPTEFLAAIVSHLESARLPYMVVGGVASNAYGELRTTYDVDIIVDAPWENVQRFIMQLGQDFYVSEDAARMAWSHRRMFNIIHSLSGNKADIVCRKESDYAITAFERRGSEQVLGLDIQLCSPEDVILSKLDWSRRGDSERQYRDALGVAKARRTSLDLEYLTHWAEELGISELITQLFQDAELSPPPEPQRRDE